MYILLRNIESCSSSTVSISQIHYTFQLDLFKYDFSIIIMYYKSDQGSAVGTQ